jgi:hypothetical protein
VPVEAAVYKEDSAQTVADRVFKTYFSSDVSSRRKQFKFPSAQDERTKKSQLAGIIQ